MIHIDYSPSAFAQSSDRYLATIRYNLTDNVLMTGLIAAPSDIGVPTVSRSSRQSLPTALILPAL